MKKMIESKYFGLILCIVSFILIVISVIPLLLSDYSFQSALAIFSTVSFPLPLFSLLVYLLTKFQVEDTKKPKKLVNISYILLTISVIIALFAISLFAIGLFAPLYFIALLLGIIAVSMAIKYRVKHNSNKKERVERNRNQSNLITNVDVPPIISLIAIAVGVMSFVFYAFLPIFSMSLGAVSGTVNLIDILIMDHEWTFNTGIIICILIVFFTVIGYLTFRKSEYIYILGILDVLLAMGILSSRLLLQIENNNNLLSLYTNGFGSVISGIFVLIQGFFYMIETPKVWNLIKKSSMEKNTY